MNNTIKFHRKQGRFLTLLLIISSVIPHTAFSKPQEKLTGELIATGTVSVNGTPTTTGMKLSPGSRIQTGTGLAVVNFSKLGRVAVQSETDFLLDFMGSSIKGTLTLGTIVINISTGIAVNIMTPNGEVAIPSDQTPATLTVGVTSEGTHAFVKREQERPRSFRPSGAATSKSFSRLSGELWKAGTTSVNGKPATTGMTILRGSRILTGNDGSAVVNLNQLGRIATQTETELLLDFQENAVQGNLTLGTIVQNIPNGVAVNFSTPIGAGNILVNQTPATLTVAVTANDMHMFVRREPRQTAGGSCGRELSRSFRPFKPANPNGWLIPFFAVTGVGVIAAVTAVVTNPPDIPFIPVPPDLTPVVP